MTRALVLGGYGASGRILSELLLQDPQFNVTIAGRDLQRAERLAALLSVRHGGRVSARAVDAARMESVGPAAEAADLVVVASTTAVHTQTVARAALRAGADYYDILYSPAKLGVLRTMAEDIRREGCRFISDGGFHPGLPAVLVRQAAAHFDELHTAVVGSVIQQDWRSAEPSLDTVGELLDMIVESDAALFEQGRWRRPGMRDAMLRRRMRFGAPLGARACYAMALEELLPLPTLIPSLRSTGFFVGGFNPMVDWGVIPLAVLGRRFAPQRSRNWLGRLLAAGLRRGSHPPYRTVLKLEATGVSAGRAHAGELEVAHADGYYLTAACAAACIAQLVDGTIHEPGVWLQGLAVVPGRMLADLRAYGVEVTENWQAAAGAGIE